MTLADQLKTRLEERRRSREGNDVTSPVSSTNQNQASSSFVPESIAVDIQRAVQVANESSKLFLFYLFSAKSQRTNLQFLILG